MTGDKYFKPTYDLDDEDEFTLPIKWSVQSSNDEEHVLLRDYVMSLLNTPELISKYGQWTLNDSQNYRLTINNLKYNTGFTKSSKIGLNEYPLITFEQFKKHILKMGIEEKKEQEDNKDIIIKRDIYILTVNETILKISKSKSYIGYKYDNTTFLIDGLRYHKDFFDEISHIVETTTTFAKPEVKSSELTFKIVKKALYDIKWLEKEDCNDIWKELYKNMNSRLSEPIEEVDDFVLPEKWHIKCDPEKPENNEVLMRWRRGSFTYNTKKTIALISSKVFVNYSLPSEHYKKHLENEITFEQFKKYVLKND